MIKYIQYDSIDETGQHIIPVNSIAHLNKTAGSNYAPEIMKVILNLDRKPERYYVVINALGSYEVWGANRNGDAFPEAGLSHKSLRTDMNTANDYGYKTFEYYAKFYKHHVNKDPQKSFGEIIFSHWNPVLHRVEVIAAIDVVNGADIVASLEKGEPVAVSMGCRVKYDRCSICDNKAKTRAYYCKHLKNHMGQIVTPELAALWSKELGKTILPGAMVFAFNDYPRFFDMSKVYIGADRTAFILGKAASSGLVIASVDLAEAYGVTDDMFDKAAQVHKKSEIDKEVGALGKDDVDGTMRPVNNISVFRKALDEKMNKTIAAEPRIPNKLIDSVATAHPLSKILSTILGLGIHPKPDEFQRIVLIRIGNKPLADELEKEGMVFDYKSPVDPQEIDISINNYDDTLARSFSTYLEKRSCFPTFLYQRVSGIEKSAQNGTDYWNRPSMSDFHLPGESQKMEIKIGPEASALAGIAALYAGLKLKAQGYGPKELAKIFTGKPWLRSIIGGGVLYNIFEQINKAEKTNPMLGPASNYENILQNTNFSGKMVKQSALSELTNAIVVPNAYIFNSYNQKSLCKIGSIQTGFSVVKNNIIANSINCDLLKKKLLEIK